MLVIRPVSSARLLAKAIASTAAVPFLSRSGADLSELLVVISIPVFWDRTTNLKDLRDRQAKEI